MINLMYVILIAMMALNVSSDVLRGFTSMDDALTDSFMQQKSRNDSMAKELFDVANRQHVKGRPLVLKADSLRSLSEEIYRQADFLKEEMEVMADGAKDSTGCIQNKDDLEAASQVMLSPVLNYGEPFIEEVRRFFLLVRKWNGKDDGASYNEVGWLQKNFEQMPVSAAMAILTKVKLDVAVAEGNILNGLLNEVTKSDLSVNKVEAIVIPESSTVLQNTPYKARVVLAAMDSTNKPQFYQFKTDKQFVPLKEGYVHMVCNAPGNQRIQGEMVTMDSRGEELRKSFSSDFTVIKPSATIASELTKIVYAGIENPIKVSAFGVTPDRIRMVSSNGNVEVVGGSEYLLTPSRDAIGEDINLSVYVGEQLIEKQLFRVRSLPKPIPYLKGKGKEARFLGGRIKRGALLEAEGLRAAIDDGVLDIPFSVVSFETVMFDTMGNAIPQLSNGNRFSSEQRNTIRQLRRNQRFYISKIKVIEPDNKQSLINSTMEVIIE